MGKLCMFALQACLAEVPAEWPHLEDIITAARELLNTHKCKDIRVIVFLHYRRVGQRILQSDHTLRTSS